MDPASIGIERITEATPELEAALARLLPLLSSAAPPSGTVLEELLNQEGTRLFVARVDGATAGTLTLVTFRIPSGIRAWIEDVIVDPAFRQRGLGEALTRAALHEARRLGARTVELTSRPIRVAANRLYQRVGFERRDTNVYRLRLGPSP